MHWRRWSVPAVAAALLLATACGSTAQQRSAGGTLAGPGNSVASDGLGTTGSASGGSTGSFAGSTGGATGAGTGSSGFAGTSGSSGPSGDVANGSGTSGTSSTTSGGAASSSGSRNGFAPGGPIKVGYLYSADQQAVADSFGLKGVAVGDATRQYEALGADLNKRGGILGRQVTLIGHNVNAANEVKNPDEEENRACTDFAQDRRVFAVLGNGAYLTPCLAKRGIPTVTAASYEDPATVDRDLVFDGGGMLVNVLAEALITRLGAQGYFSGWNIATGAAGPAPVKVGLLYQDLPVFRRYYDDIKKHLKARGITVDPADEFRYAPTVDGVAKDSQAAVLKFKADGVTHVLGAALLFFKAASNQQYHPRYGFDTIGPPTAYAENQDASQLHGSLGVGWRPTYDVAAPEDPGPVSPKATRCLAIMRAAGEDMSARSVAHNALLECEMLWSLEAGLNKGGTVSLTALRAGFNALGSTTPVISFGERWAPDRHASNTTVADLGYVDACSCFKYGKARTTY